MATENLRRSMRIQTKRKLLEYTNDTSKSCDSYRGLGLDLELEILSWLPAISVLRFRSVCKSWNAATRSHDFVDAHCARSVHSRRVSNWTTFFFRAHGIKGTHTSIVRQRANCGYSPKLKVIFSSAARDLDVISLGPSCNGLICLFCSREIFYLWNPITQMYLRLQSLLGPLYGHVKANVFGFGYDFRKKEYKVLYSRHDDVGFVENISICSVPDDGDPTPWRVIPRVNYYFLYITEGVIVNGRLHWLVSISPKTTLAGHCMIASFDLHHEQFHKISLQKIQMMSWNSWAVDEIGLAELGGSLAFVEESASLRKIHVWIMEEYGNSETWTLQFSFCTLKLAKYPFSHVIPRPMRFFLKDGKLYFCSRDRIVSYDPNIDKCNLCMQSYWERWSVSMKDCEVVVPFTDSLVSLKGALQPKKRGRYGRMGGK